MRGCIEQLTALSQRCNQAASSLPHAAELYDDLSVEYEKARQQVVTDTERLQEVVEIHVTALQAKDANPFSMSSVMDLLPLPAPDLTLAIGLVAAHNQRSTEHAQTVSAAAQRVELATLNEIYTEYISMKNDLAAKTTTADQLKAERGALSTRILQLEREEADPLPLAGSLTSALARLLGRNSLQFELSSDGTHYKITRDGGPALGLSEGERTAIALLYFLAELRSKTAPSDPIVVVDDPVSSLDQGVLFGVSAHLWSELAVPARIAQVFVLTHSFELFRQWVNQLDSAKGHLPAGGQTVFELRSRYETRGGVTRVVPSFEEWPADWNMRKRLRSQYHFLFAQVAQVVIESGQGPSLARQLDILSSAPNSARKMLEGFLAFRQPAHIGDFTNSLRKALAGLQETDPVRVRVTRYLHAYSHNEEGDHSKPLEPGEAPAVLACVFELIKLLDEPHFDAMCAALDLEAATLISASGAVVDVRDAAATETTSGT